MNIKSNKIIKDINIFYGGKNIIKIFINNKNFSNISIIHKHYTSKFSNNIQKIITYKKKNWYYNVLNKIWKKIIGL